MTYRLELTADPAEFLDVAGHHLAADPVLNTVAATAAARDLADRQTGVAARQNWYLVVRDDRDTLVGVGMRTAPFAPRPLYLLPMPDDAAVALARVLHQRGEEVGGVNGALGPVRACADEMARLTGGVVSVAQHTRLFTLTAVVEPEPVPGRVRRATPDDADLVRAWFNAFGDDADTQAGRPTGVGAGEKHDRDEVLRRITGGRVWVREDGAGTLVHLTGVQAPSFGAQRIGPVYTPPEHRGRGYASATVAAVSRRILAGGDRPCLFTDQANPTSNKIYRAVGFQPVVDMISARISAQ